MGKWHRLQKAERKSTKAKPKNQRPVAKRLRNLTPKREAALVKRVWSH